MAVDVYAADEQADAPVELERWSALARAVLAERGIKGDAEVSLLFVDELAIAALNQQFLGREGPTDVLAFPIEDDPAPSGRSPDLGGTGPGSDASDDPLVLLGEGDERLVCKASWGSCGRGRDADVRGAGVDRGHGLLAFPPGHEIFR